MKNIDRAVFVLVFTLALDLGNPAYAYLDPGTGSMILQLLLGGIAGILVIGKAYWQRLWSRFSGDGKVPSIEAKDNK